MTVDVARMPMSDRFQHLFSVISSRRFLDKQGLGNEVPFFICPFKPEEGVEMVRMQSQLVSRLAHTGVRALEVNLYDVTIEILKRDGDFEWLIDNEQSSRRAAGNSRC